MDVLKNYINGKWVDSVSKETIDVLNPATGEVLAKVPFGEATAGDVETAAAAHKAYLQWKDVPVLKRIQPLFKLKQLLEDTIAFINSGTHGNMACVFTSSGSTARKFRNEAMAGNIGINIGVAAPMAQLPFSGWKESFFGDLHGQGKHAIEFFTQTKVVIERWPKEWARNF